jgi:hypothetical protein
MKSKDQTLLEEAYDEIARRQHDSDNRLPHITKALEDNKDLKFESNREFYKWSERHLPGLWNYSQSDLHPVLGPELQKAYEAGYNSEDYACPFSEKTLWWWMAEDAAGQGAADV